MFARGLLARFFGLGDAGTAKFGVSGAEAGDVSSLEESRGFVLPRPRRVRYGRDIRFYEYGEKDRERVLLVHGFRGDHNGLALIGEALASHGFNAVVPDLPGFGEAANCVREDGHSERSGRSVSQASAKQYNLDFYARWLAECWRAADTPRFVLAHSFGTQVLGRALSARLFEPAAVTLVNPILVTPFYPLTPLNRVLRAVLVFYYRLGAALPERVGRRLLADPFTVRLLSEFMAKTGSRALRRFIHGQHAAHFSGFSSVQTLYEAFRASIGGDCAGLTPADYRDDGVTGRAVTVRAAVSALMIAGGLDAIAPPSGLRMHGVGAKTLFSGCEAVVLPGVGHLAHYERPLEVAGLAAEFFTAKAAAVNGRGCSDAGVCAG